MDGSFKLLYRSPAAARLTGWTNEDMIGVNATKNIHPEDQLHAAALVTEVMANPAKIIIGKFRMQHKTGHYLWVEGTLTNYLHDKNVNAVVFNFRDVTERIIAEKKLTASERRFRKLIENNHDIIVLTDAAFKIIYRSPSATRITGWTDEEMQSIDLIQKVHPDDQEIIAGIFEECMANPGKHLDASYRTYNKKGDCLHMEGIMINLLHEEDVHAIVLNLRDVTDRIEAAAKLAASELRFRLLIENSTDGIDMSDEFSNNIYRSPGAIKITGILQKENQRNLAHPDDLEIIKNKTEELIKKPGIPIPFQARFLHALGHYIWVEGTMTNLLHVSGVQAFVTNFRDITQRKEAEQQKEFDAHNLDALINNTHDLLWSVDRDFKLITSNKAFDDMLWSMTGIMPEKGNSILLEELGKRKLKRFKQYYKRAFAGEIFTEIEHDGSAEDFWSEISFYPIYEGKEVIGTACFSRDITEKKKAEEEIRKSNERFELVVTATNDVIWDWDLNSNTFWRNRNFYVHFGYDEKTVSRDTSAWHDGIYPEDKKRVLSAVNASIKNKQHFWKDEYRYLKSDKTIAFVVDCGYILYTEKGKAYRMVGAMLDITNRKKAEQDLKESFDEKQTLAERMSIILNTLPAHIALLDSNGFIIDVNDAWRYFADSNGFIGSNYCIGDNYMDISKNAFGKEKDDGKKVAAGIKAVLKNQVKEFVFEYSCHSPKIKRWFRMVVTPLQEKEYAGAVVMHIDISKLRMLEQERLIIKMEEQKKITKAMLLGQEKERNYIGQELHDNINQILAGTKMFLGIAGNKNKEVKELIKYPMELLDSSMDEIRTLCHKMVTPLKNVDLEELIRDLLHKFDQATKIKSRFVYAVNEGILSDELQLNIYRIIQELVNNIHKYSGAKKVSITVKAKHNVIAITVTDDGRGFDTGKKRKGVGISNMINRVASFNGAIEIKSSEGNGCKTSINIPY